MTPGETTDLSQDVVDRILEHPVRSDSVADPRSSFVTGSGRYLSDIIDAEQDFHHAVFVRSISAHARLAAVHTGDAAKGDGVSVFTASDLGMLMIPGQLRPNMVAVDGMDRSVLADDAVRYVGEPIAMVVASSVVEATDAAGLVTVDYHDLPVVVDAVDAATDETVLFPRAGTNVVERQQVGHLSPATLEQEVELAVDAVNPRITAVPLESLGVVAIPTGSGLTVLCGHQIPHGLRRDLATILDLPVDKIRVIVPDVGGAFGSKGPLYTEYVAVARAAMILAKPIAWRETRREHFQGGTHGRSQRHKIRIWGTRQGRIRGLEVDILADLGAYPSAGSFIPRTTLSVASGPYDISEVRVSLTSVVTNTAPIGPYRGAGRPEATHALEYAIEEFSAEIGLDPIDVRRANLLRSEQLPLTTATGAHYDGGDYGATLDVLLRIVDLPSVRAIQETEAGGTRRHGVGVCLFVESAGGSPKLGEFGRVVIKPDGSAEVFCGSTGSGQGHSTTLRRVITNRFAIPLARIRVHTGDTEIVERGVGSFGSRSTQTGVVAVERAAREVERRCRRAAGRLLETAEAALVPASNGFAVKGVPGAVVTFSEIVTELDESGEALDVDEYFEPGRQTFPYGAYGAVVCVDLETGATEVVRLVAVDDCGRRLNPSGVEGQVIGAAAQGFGQAMTELVEYDAGGQLLTGSLIDYLLPSAVTMPPVTTSHVSTATDINDLGVRGVGEAGSIGVPPAIAFAVRDAIGVVPRMPFRPETIWNELHS